MLALRSILRSNSSIVKNAVQQRNMSAICTPARNKVSRGEIIVLSTLMLIGWSAVPAWVLVNMKHYRNKD